MFSSSSILSGADSVWLLRKDLWSFLPPATQTRVCARGRVCARTRRCMQGTHKREHVRTERKREKERARESERESERERERDVLLHLHAHMYSTVSTRPYLAYLSHTGRYPRAAPAAPALLPRTHDTASRPAGHGSGGRARAAAPDRDWCPLRIRAGALATP